MNFNKLLLCVLLLSIIATTGCRPDYPKCDKDSDCALSDKGMAEGRLMCVNGICQQCAQNSDCAGLGMECNAGVCERILGYCEKDNDCLNGQKCRDNICSSECSAPMDCGDGQDCKAGKCVAKVECTLKSDCKGGFNCVGGKCISDSTTICELPVIYFQYNSSLVESNEQTPLQNAGNCIRKNNLKVRIQGYTDERGTSEYNLALGERRARSVYNYFTQMGVPEQLLSMISYGKEDLVAYCGQDGSETCHAKNRRVTFQIR